MYEKKFSSAFCGFAENGTAFRLYPSFAGSLPGASCGKRFGLMEISYLCLFVGWGADSRQRSRYCPYGARIPYLYRCEPRLVECKK